MAVAELILKETDTAGSAVFEEFYSAYDKAFILPDEKEDRAGFVECLQLNREPRRSELVQRFGDFRELCITVHDSSDGRLVGGANFIAIRQSEGLTSANLNYVFLVAEARGKGRFRPLFDAVRDRIASVFAPPGMRTETVLVFIEQNDPLKLSDEDYHRDTELTGMDQVDRLRIWSRLGARLVDFPYVQPPLSASQEADDGLVYSVLGTSADSLDPRILHKHLRSFFGISVLKGSPIEGSATAKRQLEELQALARSGGQIALVDLSDKLNGLTVQRNRVGANGSIRDWIAATHS